jgi:AmmeMemoRadiSam system protein B/AmmeMemoRadiSam system protein A
MSGKHVCQTLKYWLLCLFFLLATGCQPGRADEVRQPAWAGSFYPADPGELAATIDEYSRRAAATGLVLPVSRRLRAVVMPHAGYQYSGWTAAHAGRILKSDDFRKVVLIGPDHRVGFANGSVSGADYYQTPLGRVPVHHDAEVLLGNPRLFRTVAASEQSEHSLEVILPFLQRYLRDFQLVPLVLGNADLAATAGALAPLIDRRTLVVVSSDLSHYLPYGEAVVKDRDTIDRILAGDSAALAAADNNACGKNGLLVLLELARRLNWQPVLLHYANSGDTAGDRNRVVGYAALAFYEGEEEKIMSDQKQLSPEQGRDLVQLARLTIGERLRQPVAGGNLDKLAVTLAAPACQEKRGVFVTLHKHGQLRGCIGSLTGYRPIVEGVREHALNAAFNDYRFQPLRAEELPELDIEVSILSEPVPLAYRDGADLLARLRPGVDGVIIRSGGASATFLPQVWEQLPDPAAFLSHLCQKAGLPAQEWRQGRLEVMTYQVRYFAEEK